MSADTARANTLASVGTGCAILGLAAWVFYFRAFAGSRGEDWMVFYTAARTFFDGQLSLIYDGDKLTALLNARFSHVLGAPLPLHPFLYPPHYLLILLPFGLLPPFLGLGSFLFLSFAALAAALLYWAKDGTERWLYCVSVLVSPAAAIVVCLGQNTFLSCALLVGGFAAVSARRPVLGGILLGLLSYKPQLFLMVPVALIASRQWKVLASLCATGVILVVVSTGLFGIGIWRDWLSIMTAPSALTERWSSIARINGQNIFAYAAFLGAPLRLANALQIAATGLGAIFVYWFHRRAADDELKLIAVLAATTLTAPHFLGYDAVAIEIAATMFLAYTLRRGASLFETAIAGLAWLSPLINPPTVFAVGVATPLLIVLFLALVVRREARTRGRALGPAAFVPV
jgi:hypothetical protein